MSWSLREPKETGHTHSVLIVSAMDADCIRVLDLRALLPSLSLAPGS
jgi:hypothetical protein